MKNANLQDAEQLGMECGKELLNRLLTCKTQAQASPVITEFLTALCNERGQKHRHAVCGGVAVILVDVLLTGLDAIRARSA